MDDKMNVGIFIFNQVEVMDMSGPFEVFALAERNKEKIFKVITIGETMEMITAKNGLQVVPNTSFSDNPELDILIIPGGTGAEIVEIKNETALNWIKDQAKKTDIVAAVCTGAFLLAETGLLNGKKATTHWLDLDWLEKNYPEVTVVRNQKFVDEGNILTSGGISAGINMSFHLLKRLCGEEIAAYTAKRMEYDIEI